MNSYDFTPLENEIRACFPAITRHRLAISHSAAAHNGNILALRVRVTLDERFPTFDSDKLMAVLNADEMTAKDRRSIVKGTFAGKPCEIILVTRQPAANC
jgi:hypothetical protein